MLIKNTNTKFSIRESVKSKSEANIDQEIARFNVDEDKKTVSNIDFHERAFNPYTDDYHRYELDGEYDKKGLEKVIEIIKVILEKI